MIRITEIDKKHEESDLCQGAIGHKSMPKELEMLNIYRERMDTAQQFPISFLPNLGNEIYYVDPAYPQRYIALDTYFEYLKQARVAELQQIAQALGAKHFSRNL